MYYKAKVLLKNQRILATICFSLFFSWLLAFPFQGRVLYSLIDSADISSISLVRIAIISHFTGLLSGGFIIRKQSSAKAVLLLAAFICAAGSLIFFFKFYLLWYIAMSIIAYLSGLVVAGWAFYYKSCTRREDRFRTAADILVLSNLGMIIISVITEYLKGYGGLTAAICILSGVLLTGWRLDAGIKDEKVLAQKPGNSSQNNESLIKPLLFLCLFILILTVNSGLMYQVINPAFAHHTLLTGYYWALPYVFTLLLLRSLPTKYEHAYILYIALILIGVSFVLFMLFDRSTASYLIIDTFLMGAFGVCDLFWWSIIGRMLEYFRNPARIFGLGLSMNVLGILAGGIIGDKLDIAGNQLRDVPVVALIIIFIVMSILPLLNIQLTKLLRHHVFLVNFSGAQEKPNSNLLGKDELFSQLTEKEIEVVRLLLKGLTYKSIANELYNSDNTIKYHIKNIYQKLNINSKVQLIRLFKEKEL